MVKRVPLASGREKSCAVVSGTIKIKLKYVRFGNLGFVRHIRILSQLPARKARSVVSAG